MNLNHLRSRREFFRRGYSTIATLGAAAAFGQAGLLTAQAQTTGDYKALVCIFLFGGNDANNMLIPNESTFDTQYGYKTYQAVRQNLALPQNTLASIGDKASGKAFGLHPSLQPLADLYNKAGRVTLVANVGTLVQPVPRTTKPNFTGIQVPNNLYSHSDQQSEWQNLAVLGGPNAGSGWAGRLADRIYSPGCSSSSTPQTFGDRLPTIGVSGNSLELLGHCTQQTSITSGNFGVIGPDAATKDDLTNMLSLGSGVTLVQAAQGGLASAIRVAGIVDKAAGTPVTGFPNTDIGNQLAQVATLIKLNRDGLLGATRQIYFCTQGGYDTHSDELNSQRTLLADLAQAMAAFDTYVSGPALNMADKVVTFTQSEFSRTFQPNGNGGTDHAWGEHAIVMGPVKGGQIYGAFPHLVLKGPDDSGDRGNWVPTTSVDEYGATMAKWFGLSSLDDLNYVFPNLTKFGSSGLGFLG